MKTPDEVMHAEIPDMSVPELEAMILVLEWAKDKIDTGYATRVIGDMIFNMLSEVHKARDTANARAILSKTEDGK